MTALTAEEKRAGRALRDWVSGAYAAGWAQRAGVTYGPPYIVWLRHECREDARAVTAGTWAMPLRQVYWRLEGTRFAFIFRAGTCPRCGTVARSRTGRFVIAADNPPEKGAIVAIVQPYGTVPADQRVPAPAP